MLDAAARGAIFRWARDSAHLWPKTVTTAILSLQSSPILCSGSTIMAALARRELEAAKLKDENVTLSQEVTKLATHVNTSLKLNARIFREQTSSEKAIQRLTKEVQDLKPKNGS